MNALMEIQYLKYFASVADTLSFSKAAKRCHVSQPSLSAQIRILEDRLGTQLFHRNPRSVSLTKEGQALIPRVKKILLEVEALGTAAKDLQDPLSGTLVVGATPLIPHSGLFDRLSSMSEKRALLRLSFREGGSTELIDGLLSGQMDLVFLPMREKIKNPQLDYVISEKMEVVICSPKGGDKDLPFINIKRGCGLGEFLMDSAKRLRRENEEVLQASHIEMIKKWIQLGMGWSILPSAILRKADRKRFDIKSHSALKPIELCAVMLKGQRAESLLPQFQSSL